MTKKQRETQKMIRNLWAMRDTAILELNKYEKKQFKKNGFVSFTDPEWFRRDKKICDIVSKIDRITELEDRITELEEMISGAKK